MMAVAVPNILALDFDGVLCDGLIEYFQTAWKAYCQIWKPANENPPEDLATQFYRLRPVVETGWEMPVLLRSLLLGTPEAEILSHWGAIAPAQIAADHLTATELGHAVDSIRDGWITTDLENWLAQHRFYPGVIDRLRQTLCSPVHALIITTKEGRFVHKLLQQQGIKLVDSQVLGKEVKQPKAETLRALLQRFQADTGQQSHIWFVEDRLKTLQSIQTQPDLNEVKLFLADWGYNTAGDRDIARHNSRLQLLSLETFAQDFPDWISD
jgi:phosphoglycolate phosphatase-like HAD superfamily hydrolase